MYICSSFSFALCTVATAVDTLLVHAQMPRLNPAKTLQSVKWLLEHYRDVFHQPDAAYTSWETWAKNHPLRVEDVVDPPKWEWPQTCGDYTRNLPADLASRCTSFRETIEYRNAINGTLLSKAQLAASRVQHGFALLIEL